MRRKYFLTISLILGLILTFSACSKNQVEEIIPESEITSCTSPSEKGCEACLRAHEDGFCVELSWSGGENTEIDPWYNVNSVVSCDSDLIPCDSCLKRDQEDLQALLSNTNFQECNCDNIVLKDLIDPCFMPSSCECLCQRFDRLNNACPDNN